MPTEIIASTEKNTRDLIQQVLLDLGKPENSVVYLDSIDELASILLGQGSERETPLPRLIIVDFLQGNQPIWDFLEQKRNNVRLAGVPVLVLTRDASPVVRQGLNDLGADVLVRPCLAGTFIEKVKNLATNGSNSREKVY